MNKLSFKRKSVTVISLISILLLSQLNLNYLSTAKIDSSDDEHLNGITLRIVTRNNIATNIAFRSAFLASQIAIDRNISYIEFHHVTTDEGWKNILQNPSNGIDLAWGVDPSLFEKLENWGVLKPIDNVTLQNYIDARIPDTISVHEMKQKDTSGDIIWVGTALSSYGFTVNHGFLSDHGLPVPSTWEELASPVYCLSSSVSAISVADSILSIPDTKIYQIILQLFGWENGWDILTRIGGNVGIYPYAGNTRTAVVSEEVGIGTTSDSSGILAQIENPLCEYISPHGQSVIIPMPIALGINVDNQNAAEGFIEYVLSSEGQSNWLLENVNRLPIREDTFQTTLGQSRTDIYSIYNETLDNLGSDFSHTLASANYATTMNYFHQTLVEAHPLLKLVWNILASRFKFGLINATYFTQLVDLLAEVNMTLQQSIDWNEQFETDFEFRSQKISEWKSFALFKYNSILYELQGYPSTSEFEKPLLLLIPFSFVLAALVYKRRKRKGNSTECYCRNH